MKIAVDFDGTCVSHEYPEVGKDIGAAPVLKELVEQGHSLILYTMRSFARGISPVTGKEEDGGLIDAIQWFTENEIPLYSVQKDLGQEAWTSSPKCYAHLYIDDAALGIPLIYPGGKTRPYVDWKKVRELLVEKEYL